MDPIRTGIDNLPRDLHLVALRLLGVWYLHPGLNFIGEPRFGYALLGWTTGGP